MFTYHGVNVCLNVQALVGAFNQEKALVGAFSVITNLRGDLRLQLYSGWTLSTHISGLTPPTPPTDTSPEILV